jgi:hypothetical protein
MMAAEEIKVFESESMREKNHSEERIRIFFQKIS